LKAVHYLKNHQNNFAPLAYTYALFEVRKEDDGKYYTQSFTKVKQPKQLHFRENLCTYQWRSFSASSIISSNLKGSGRATLLVKKQVVLITELLPDLCLK
jgi:hypothetical protein